MHSPKHQKNPHPDEIAAGEWYRQPVLWLGALIFVASLAGCVWMIVLGADNVDEALPTQGATILKMPMARPTAQPASPTPEASTTPESR